MHHGALAADERVQEARLPHVWTSHDRDVRVGGWRLSRGGGKTFDDGVEQIARSVSLDRRDGVRVAKAELVELGCLSLTAPRVRLVRDEDDRLPTPAKLIRDVVLDRQYPGLRIDEEQDDVGLRDRRLGLAPYCRLHLARSWIVEAAGVDE